MFRNIINILALTILVLCARLAVMTTCTGGCPGKVESPASSAMLSALQFFANTQCYIQEDWPASAPVIDGQEFEFIVVGAGTAGSVVAGRLSDIFDKVILIEAGGDPPIESTIPAYRAALKNSEYDWGYTTVNDNYSSQALHNGVQKHPRGKMVGGTGAMNDMVYARGYPQDYNRWASHEDARGWDWESVLHFFKESESFHDERITNTEKLMAFHGQKGPIKVVGFNDSSKATKGFLESFAELGYRMVTDITYPYEFGAGRFSHTIRDGRRETSATAYLREVYDRLYILKNATVTKILFDSEKVAKGVEVLFNKTRMNIFAKAEIFLSAGAFNTPKILMHSGIGPKKLLEALEIDIVQTSPVGENLQDHTMIPFFFKADPITCEFTTEESYFETIKYIFNQSGYFSRSDSMAAYFSLEAGAQIPDFGIYTSCNSKGIKGFKEGCMAVLGYSEEICSIFADVNENYELFSVTLVLFNPASRGRVEIQSRNIHDPPLIYSGSFSDPTDLERMGKAILKTLDVANTTFFKSVNAELIKVNLSRCSNLSYGSESYWRCYALNMVCAAWHPVGTCRIGNWENGVVDEFLNVRGIKNLRVVDASVMPTIIRGNTNAPTVMIAEKISALVRGLYAEKYTNNTTHNEEVGEKDNVQNNDDIKDNINNDEIMNAGTNDETKTVNNEMDSVKNDETRTGNNEMDGVKNYEIATGNNDRNEDDNNN